MTSLDTPVTPRDGTVSGLLDELAFPSFGRRNHSGTVGTGFEPLDLVLEGGLLGHELVLLGGRPGVGKTLTALQWSRAIAGAGRPVTFVCYEHDRLSLLGRLLVQELVVVGAEHDPTSRLEARRAVMDLTLGRADLESVRARCPVVLEAMSSLRASAPDLQVVQGAAYASDVTGVVQRAGRDVAAGGVLVVDYLQKVPVSTSRDLREQVVRATEALKEFAVSSDTTVVALAAVDAAGIAARRLRLEHLRGSDALAHECDVAILINEKSTATAARHLRYDLLKLEASKKKLIFSVEKNRRGDSDVHLEFDKDFANFRVNPRGSFAADALADGEDSGDQ